MKIKSKYKIARRLGAPVFEKTQTQKFALNLEKKGRSKGFSKMKTEFGIQLNEKQKARFVYVIAEKQFSNYVKTALAKKTSNPAQTLFEALESRVDNIVYRCGLAKTRLGAKQMVSHGHIKVNGRRTTSPSMKLSIGDKIEVNDRSLGKPLFADFDERFKDITVPSWINMNASKKLAEIVGSPVYIKTENMFDLNTVIEFYSR